MELNNSQMRNLVHGEAQLGPLGCLGNNMQNTVMGLSKGLIYIDQFHTTNMVQTNVGLESPSTI